MTGKSRHRGFDDSLTLISLWGFLVLFLLRIFSIDLGPWTDSVLLIIAGAGLMLEGQVLTARKWLRNGLQGNEFSMFATIILGGTAFLVGILSMPIFTFNLEKLLVIQGFIALLSLIFIALQRWVIK